MALPGCSIQSTWRYPWGEGEGTQLSPPHAGLRVIPLRQKGGSARELVRSSGAISAYESSLPAASARPTLHRHPLRTLSAFHREELRPDWGSRGHALATAHARGRERPAGLQLPEEPAAGRGSRGAGAILKSDPRSPGLCVSSRVLARVLRTQPAKREDVGDAAAGGRHSWRRDDWWRARPALLSRSIPLRRFYARPLPEGRGCLPWYPEPARGWARCAPAERGPHLTVPCPPEAAEEGDAAPPSASE